ncbi:MAG TPA: shikimate dehydrogenase [Candidatus Acidoferrum sp.]|nr:shikimate dehydrogenase [Candidatus Acidoferrum sp.]
MRLFGKGVGRVCAVAAATTAAEMSRQVRSASRSARTIELRLDWLRSDAERARFVHWLKAHQPPKLAFLATCRRKEGGGKFAGDIGRQLYWLSQAREAGCQWCDVEMETFRELPEGFLRAYPVPIRIMLSIHDFERTPNLPRNIVVARHGQVDAVKIAAQAKTITDSVRLLKVARHSRNFVAVPMGDVGLPARLLALREGSELAYAPISEATAPGQVSLEETLRLYRPHTLNQKTQVYGVIGDPIVHSLSPLLHNTGFAARHVNAVYLPFLVHQLGDFLKAIPEFDIRGFSVTIPHKQTILKHLKECDSLAAEIGAVNTVIVRRDGSLYGRNTDYVGVLRALQEKLRIKGSRVLIFGAGGSARAAGFALVRAGAQVCICARRESVAKQLACAVGGEAIPRRALRAESFDAMLNATPIGMHPHEGVSPLSARELQCRIVMDLIYRPQRTKLLEIAAQKGIATVSGVNMFLAQGFAQWEIWTGKPAPEAVMRRAVLSALRWPS